MTELYATIKTNLTCHFQIKKWKINYNMYLYSQWKLCRKALFIGLENFWKILKKK